MTDRLGLRPHAVRREDREDGTIVLHSAYDLGPVDRSTGVWLDRWANATPDAVFLAERSGAGWRKLSYSEARDQVYALDPASLIERYPAKGTFTAYRCEGTQCSAPIVDPADLAAA